MGTAVFDVNELIYICARHAIEALMESYWESGPTLCPYDQLQTSYGMRGRGLKFGFSSSSNTVLRLPSSFWKGVPFRFSSVFFMAAFNPSSEWNVSLRSIPMIFLAIFLTEPSTLALCFGFLTPAGMIAML